MRSGFDRQRAGDADALALSARELVREAVELAAVEPDQFEQLHDPLAQRPPAARQPMDDQRLGDDLLDAHARIERAEGVLEDRLGAAAEAAQRRIGQARDVLAVEQDAAGRRLGRAAAPDCRWCSCPSRIRRRGPEPRRAATAKDTPATACSGGPARSSRPGRREMPHEVGDLEQRRHASAELAPARAAHDVIVADLLQIGPPIDAGMRPAMGAARMEGAARRPVGEARHAARDGRQRPGVAVHAEARDRVRAGRACRACGSARRSRGSAPPRRSARHT